MPTDLRLRESDEIQGDIIAGFKKDHVTLLFLKFEDAPRARAWLRTLIPKIATTRQVATFNEAFSAARRAGGGDDPKSLKAVWTGVTFTFPGLAVLIGRDPYENPPLGGTLQAFQEGSRLRAGALGDTGDSSPDNWLFGNGRTQPVHAVLTVAADTPADLQAAVTAQRDAAAEARIVIVFQQNAATLTGTRRGKEHFGFKDGVSEPGVLGFDPPSETNPEEVKGHPGTRLVPAGHFVIGEPVAGGGTGDLPDWAKNGSFQVVRRLAQDVPGWWAQVAVQLKILKEAKAVPADVGTEWFAARLVGRWRSGAPVCKHPDADVPFDPTASNDNDFGFADDPDGLLTPLFSHLRKTSPRDGLVVQPGTAPIPAENLDSKRIMRRGAPYGQPFDPASEGPGGPDDPRGLLFVSYQSDIAEQFEFIQTAWIDDVDFPPGRDPLPGGDPMVGLDCPVSYESRAAGGERRTTALSFKQFVRTEGSVYAFAPSLGLLRGLADGSLTQQAAPATQLPGTGGAQTGTGGTQQPGTGGTPTGSGGTQQPDTGAQQPGTAQPGGQQQPKPPALVVDEFLAVPDRQRQGGVSEHWVFRQGRYRKVSVADGSHQDALLKGDGAIGGWDGLQGVSRVDAVLPIPGKQRVGGRSKYWFFHTVGGKQVYRGVSITDGDAHTDTLDHSDRSLARWGSLAGVGQVDAFLPVPDLQGIGGKSWYWVFHSTGGRQAYRLISVFDSGLHMDALERSDRELSAWVSLEGVTRVDSFLAVPDRQRTGGKSEFWVFHQDRYRRISVADGSGHPDRLEQADRSAGSWTSLA
ncbi:Dyp-type peroxidase [Kitasatospora sp. NBC_00240]|uniref:Dyp-type peroxidase n=1 Tax=Kitasatospora sp. NBC_00240 TaxID=2903567 RepID=UPI0022536634|nr:Dyp-type peroxidase [Kitasatospora sp. NBC_00240]MCX5213110.1 Dyp-type peroxidase [Kitasatospora sp. NBC_00240]